MKQKTVIQIVIDKLENYNNEDVCKFLNENKKELLSECQEQIEIAYNEGTKRNVSKYQNANDYYNQTY